MWRRVILYDQACRYETDYTRDRLLCEAIEHFQFEFVSLSTTDLLAFDNANCEFIILVFTSNLVQFEQIQTLVARLKPCIILHFSDEWGQTPQYASLADSCSLVLRQHWFPKTYPSKSNLFQIPLGYMTGFPPMTDAISFRRTYLWSFIGTISPERKDMLDYICKRWQNQPFFCRGGGVDVKDMAAVYAQSTFVPNGRGTKRLDCFRIYEAMMAGAIPIVVGSQDELEETFVFEGPNDKLPWVIAQTWEEAIHKCEALLEQPLELRKLQKANKDWLMDHFLISRERIAKVLVGLQKP